MIEYRNIISSLPKIISSTLLMLCFSPATLHANEKEKQLALEVYPQWYSTDNYTVQGNIGIEKAFQGNNWVHYYVKPSATYALDNNWAVHGGLGGYYKDYQDNQNRWEVRPYAGVSHYYVWTEKLKLSSYLRAEKRYYYYTGDQSSSNTARLRFRVRSSYTLDSHSFISSWNKLTVGVEVFQSQNSDNHSTNMDDIYDSETRITLGLERKLNDQRKLRFELAWRYQSPPGQVSSASVNTVYFKIKYYPAWGDTLRNTLFHREIDE